MIKAMRYLAPQATQESLSRRRFLKVMSLGACGFIIGCTAPPPSDPNPTASASPGQTPGTDGTPANSAALNDFNAFVKVGNDDTVTVVIKHAEFGQGVTTGLTTIVAEEIDARWDQMRWEFAPADASQYNNLAFGPVQGTGGSSSIANSWEQLRKAGAAAKFMLVSAAAQAWDAPVDEIGIADGKLMYKDKSATFGEMAEAAASISPPDDVTLKDPKDFKLIGKDVTRLDAKSKSQGQATFTIDVQKPGMVMAAVAHSPRFGGKVKSFKAEKALEMPGVKEVVEIPGGVAVVADSFWTASKARKALEIEWDDSSAEMRGSEQLMADFKKLADIEGAVARNDGDVAAVQKAAGSKLIEVEYEFPYLAHAPMEPMGCVVELTEDGAILTHGSQIQTLDQGNVAQALGLAGPQKVTIESVFGGGSFGRRATPNSDYVVECAHIAKAMKTKDPVKLTWDRTDDLHGGRYRPMSFHRVKGTVGQDGKPESTFHRAVIQSFMKGTPFGANIEKTGLDESTVEGSSTLPYAIPNQRVESVLADVNIPTLWWRSVGHTQNAFVTETFFDRLCREGGQDPVKMRQELLKESPRDLAVLNLAVEKAGPKSDKPNTGRGVAVHKSFGSYVAEVVDVVMESGKVKVEKVTCAVDCGMAVNPDIVKAQMESGIIYGLSAALAEQIVLKDGVVKQRNFDSYPVARMPQAPAIDVHIVPSGEAPTGVGEPGLPPIAPALANAITDATGKWVTKLPLKLEGWA